MQHCHADLSALRTVLAELGISATGTTQLLLGAQLATVPLDEFSFGVAMLPASGPDGTPAATPATMFLDAGIACRQAGAQVESQAVSSGGDRVDAAALIPGTERVLGPVRIEVKALQGHGLAVAVNQLAALLARSGAMFGLVVYDGPRQEPGPASGFTIMAMHIDELREHVLHGSLGSTLVYVRNSAVHGPTRCRLSPR